MIFAPPQTLASAANLRAASVYVGVRLVEGMTSLAMSRARSSWLMVLGMLRRISQFKVFESVVCLVAVDVVNDFGFIERASERGTHNESVFKNPASLTSVWMRRRPNHFVALAIAGFTAIPVWIVNATKSVPTFPARGLAVLDRVERFDVDTAETFSAAARTQQVADFMHSVRIVQESP